MEIATVADFDFELRNVKVQLADQLKALGGRTSKKVELLRDLSDFFGKHAEIELNYAKALESLFSKYNKPRGERGAVANMTKALSGRRPTASDLSAEHVDEHSAYLDHSPTGLTTDVWTVLLQQTKKRAEARVRFANNLSEEMRTRLDVLEKETLAASRRCLDLGSQLQTEMQRSFRVLDETLKNYHAAQAKLDKATEAFDKAKEKGQLKKGEKLREKVEVAKARTMACRNEYILAMVAANAHKRRYYKMELGNLVDAMDFEFHNSFKYSFQLYKDLSLQAEALVNKSILTVYDASSKVDANVEKEKFFRDNQLVFSDRRLFEFIKAKHDSVTNITYNNQALKELVNRFSDMDGMVAKLDRQIRREKQTLDTIKGVRDEMGTSITFTDDGSPKSVEVINTFIDCYSKMTVNKLVRTSVAAQLEQLGDALGDHRPSSLHNHSPDEIAAGEEEENPVPEPEPEVAAAIDKDYVEKRRKSMRITRSASGSHVEAHATEAGRDDVASMSSEPSATLGSDDEDDDTRSQDTNRDDTEETHSATHGDDSDKEEAEGSDSQVTPRKAPVPAPRSRLGTNVSQAEQLASSGQASPSSPARVVRRPAPAPPPDTSPATARKPTTRTKPDRPPQPGRRSSGSSKEKPQVQPRPPGRPAPPSGGNVAKKASPEARAKCLKFGCNLEQTCETLGWTVPVPVTACINALLATGIKDEGIFRVPGSSAQIEELKTSFERGENPLDSPDHPYSPDSIAGCLKLYLRQLENPVMTRQLYKSFVQIGNIPVLHTRLMALRETVRDMLPAAHRDLLAELFPFLHKVSLEEKTNKMSSSNLALVFGPTLMPAPKEDVGAMLRDAATINTLMMTLIDHHEFVFGDSEPKDYLPHQKVKALYDYDARNDTELSFKKNDTILLFSQVDDNWWTGEANGETGFVPSAYISKSEATSGAASPPPKDAEQFEPMELSEEIDLDSGSATVSASRGELVNPDGYLDIAGEDEESSPPADAKPPPAPQPRPRVMTLSDEDKGTETSGSQPEPGIGAPPPVPPVDYEADSRAADKQVPTLTLDDRDETRGDEGPPFGLDSTRRSSTSSDMGRSHSFGPTFAPPPPPMEDDEDEHEDAFASEPFHPRTGSMGEPMAPPPPPPDMNEDEADA